MVDDNAAVIIPEDVSSLWNSLDPAVRAALIASSSSSDSSSSNGGTATATGGGSGGAQGRRALVASGPRITNSAHIGSSSFTCRTTNPSWIKVRENVYDAIKTRRLDELAAKVQVDISVTLPDGKVLVEDKVRKHICMLKRTNCKHRVISISIFIPIFTRLSPKYQEGVKYQAWHTTPFDIAATISRGLADSAVVSRVTYSSFVSDYDSSMDGMDGIDLDEAMAEGGKDDDIEEAVSALNLQGNANTNTTTSKTILWDMTRPLVGNASKIEFLKFEDDPDARTAFWHSSAHVLGEALERLYGSRLTVGPPLAGGFYYDAYMGDGSNADSTIKEDDYKLVEAEVSKIIKEKQKFERLVVTKDELLELFAGNPFKEQIISTKIPNGARSTVYRCGDLVDLCRGPHIPNTGRIKAFAATRHSATNWLGDTDNDSLQRMYAISFPDKKLLKAWLENQEKVCKRTHERRAGGWGDLLSLGRDYFM